MPHIDDLTDEAIRAMMTAPPKKGVPEPRTPAALDKIAAMQALIDAAGNDDLDIYFLALAQAAKIRGISFTHLTPDQMLQQFNLRS